MGGGGKNIQRQLSIDDKSSKSSNITEEMAKELQIESDYTSQLVDEDESNTLREEAVSQNEHYLKSQTIQLQRNNLKDIHSTEEVLRTKSNSKKYGDKSNNVMNTDSSSSNVSSASNLFGNATMSAKKSNPSLKELKNDIFKQQLVQESIKSHTVNLYQI